MNIMIMLLILMVYGNCAGLVEKATVKELEKHFTIDIDYKVQKLAPATSGKVNETTNKGQNTFTETSAKVEMGRPIENIYLTINERRRLDKENKVYYECNRCNSKYTRKDTLARHSKSCVI